VESFPKPSFFSSSERVKIIFYQRNYYNPHLENLSLFTKEIMTLVIAEIKDVR
jgi:hypothetical protein